MIVRRRFHELLAMVAVCVVMLIEHTAFGQLPPVLNTVFPAGGRVGQTVVGGETVMATL